MYKLGNQVYLVNGELQISKAVDAAYMSQWLQSMTKKLKPKLLNETAKCYA